VRVGRYDYVHQLGDNREELFSAVRQLMLAGRYELGQQVRDFEKNFAEYLSVPHVIGVNSGTDALLLALLCLDLRPGDEVITQANTFHATVAAICLAGAKPVLVDAEEDTCLIDQSQVSEALVAATRVIMPVHLFGKPTPMANLQEIASNSDVVIVEDAAQSHGAKWAGRRTGSFGQLAAFSFHPSKNLAAAGDGGAIATSRGQHDARLRMLHRLGQLEQNNHVRIGYHSKLDVLQAVVLDWKLRQLDEWNAARRRAAARYKQQLAGLPVGFQRDDPDEEHVYHLFQLRCEHRDALLEHLIKDGIDAVVRYPTPVHLQPAFEQLGYRKGQFPIAEKLAREMLCLPMRPNLSDSEIDYVCDSLRRFFRGGA
jgi:dTDP-4-amino-4,6-dideoxygalactose transaminase